MSSEELYMQRCIQLALLGQGDVAPNPMVGSVLVYEGEIIGEGYHKKYGEEHAEVNCIDSVKPVHIHLIEQATIYVSLEPCAHFGKTPPCADLIIKHKIPKVVVGCRDPFEQVDGKGIEKLRAAGIEVIVGVLETECMELNKRFFTFHTLHRPYIILKWAETGDGKIAGSYSLPLKGSAHAQNPIKQNSLEESDKKFMRADAPLQEQGLNTGNTSSKAGNINQPTRLLISNEYSNRLVHKWRSEEMSILVGTNTALLDDPELSTRLWPGNHPVRLVVDMDLRLPSTLKIFNGKIPTIIFNTKMHSLPEGGSFPSILSSLQNIPLLFYYQVTKDVSLIHQIVNALYQLKIQSVLVEGGASLLQLFIDEGFWDEARILTNEQLIIGEGLPAPALRHHQLLNQVQVSTDAIRTYINLNK